MGDEVLWRASFWPAPQHAVPPTLSLGHIDANGQPALRSMVASANDRTDAARASQFQSIGYVGQMMLASRSLSRPRSRILGMLLDAAHPSHPGGSTILRPLWANEAMHRAYQMVRLSRVLDDRSPCHARDLAEADLEGRVASHLAETLLSLHIVSGAETVPCDDMLRDVVRDLADLYGGALGISGICTNVEAIALPAFKRRALVLMACHLVIEILSQAFQERRRAPVVVTLDQPRHRLGRLTVGYDDQAIPFGPRNGSYGVLDDLASLLESDIIYRAGGGRVVAEVEFPLS